MTGMLFRSIGGCLLLSLVLIVSACGGQGIGSEAESVPAADEAQFSQQQAESLADLAWPPDGLPQKIVSDDVILLTGVEYTGVGGNYTEFESSLVLTGKDPLSWGMYSVGGFGDLIKLNQVSATYTTNPEDEGDDLKVYFGIANYELGRWEWYEGGENGAGIPIANPDHYVSAEGTAHVVLVNWGLGNTAIHTVTFGRGGPTTTQIPQNLRATAEVGEIHLEWDPVAFTFGYNIYRSRHPDFSEAVKLNDDLLTAPLFVDDECSTHRIYYYRVTAQYAVESDYSNMVDIFVPREDLPEPPNLRSTSNSLTSIVIEWDWEGESPFLFDIYYSGVQHFNLDLPTQHLSRPGFSRKVTIENLVPGEIIYFRICARVEDGDKGRMTDDVPFETRSLYEWGDIEVIGPGEHPLDIIVAEGDLTATFTEYYEEPRIGPFGEFLAGGGKIIAARRDNGSWTTQEVSYEDNGDEVLTFLEDDNQFFIKYIDITYGNGEYLIGGYTRYNDDAWIFEGTPGGEWEWLLLDGDRQIGPGHPGEGLGIRVNNNGVDYSVSYFNVTAGQLRLRRKPLGGTAEDWSNEVIHSNGGYVTTYHSMDYNTEGQLSIMTIDFDSGELLVGEEQFGFSLFNVLPEGTTYVGSFNDMRFINGEWFASAFDGPNMQLVLLMENGYPWDISPVSYREIEAGNHSSLSVFDGRPMVLYYGKPPEEYLGLEQRWYFGLYENGEWHTEWIQIEDYSLFDFGPEARIIEFEGDLYFYFEDKSDGHIKLAKAQPPTL